jgi:predicted nuclease with TOPRIM domain
MRERLTQRIEELSAEYKSGQEMLAEVEAKRAELQQTLLRISGALQVLQELLDADASPDAAPAAPVAAVQ